MAADSNRCASGWPDLEIMYQKILVPVENSSNDQVILNHIQRLVALTRAKLLLVCVAHGWVARNFDQLKLRESEEMRQDRDYLANLCESFARKRNRDRLYPRATANLLTRSFALPVSRMLTSSR